MEGQLVLGTLWSCCQLVPREVFQVHCANINVSIFANLIPSSIPCHLVDHCCQHLILILTMLTMLFFS